MAARARAGARVTEAVSLSLLLMLLVLADQGEALRCWSCGSDTVPECRDPFEPRDLQGPSPCKGPPPPDARAVRPACYKSTVSLNEVETHVYRACDWVYAGSAAGGGSVDFCSHAARVLPAHAKVLSCSTCFSDGCNAAAAAPPPPLLLLLLPPLAVAALVRRR